MPKIRTVKVTARWETETRDFEINVMYNSKCGFYIEVPEPLIPVSEFLTDEEIKKYSVSYVRGQTVSINCKNSGFPCVLCDLENDALDKAKWLFTHLAKNSIKLRDVIIVHFDDKGEDSRFSNNETNTDHPKQGFTYGLCYCTEERVGETGGCKYYKYIHESAKPSVKEHNYKRELRLYNNFIIIDDTPENRELLEHTYRLYSELKEKLKSFLTDKDLLLTLIASNQKLIA